ncbi:MAG: TrmH family RNA methyltransferase [Candidatus Latescibacteria bacterium]|jgi:tRNA G18 (ribose-2'-O)-methylase SpoU|nr:TrmH family RNA methyltransferase [Candidatus Latescibacterota bacterium]
MPEGNRHPIYVVVENVRSLFNVGAIFRSADGVRAEGVYLTGFTGCPPRKEIHRVALGAEDSVPWTYIRDPLAAIGDLRAKGVQVVALERVAEGIDYRSFPYRLPTAVVVGHEVEGLRPETLEACDGSAQIPMCGDKTSLNVSVASGIMLYELLRVVEREGHTADASNRSEAVDLGRRSEL